ncbi:MAG: multidrug transporter [Bacteroidota bacterium]
MPRTEDAPALPVPVRPAWVLRRLVAVAAGVVAVSLTVEVLYHGAGVAVPDWVLNALTLDQERNVPTFFATGLLLAASALLLLVAGVVRRRGGRDAGYWSVLSAGFLFLALDEFVGFHERLSYALRTALGTEGWLHYAWVIPGLAVALGVAAAFVPFLRRLEPWLRGRVLVAGALYLGGALGLEVVGGAWASAVSDFDLVYALLTTVEETLELAGVVAFIYALLLYLERRAAEPAGLR